MGETYHYRFGPVYLIKSLISHTLVDLTVELISMDKAIPIVRGHSQAFTVYLCVGNKVAVTKRILDSIAYVDVFCHNLYSGLRAG